MGLVRITPPGAEPLTLAEAKTHLRLDEDFTADDVLVTALIGAAREHAEEYCRRAFVTQQWRLTLDGFPPCDVLPLPRPPLVSVERVQYVDTMGQTQTMSPGDYAVDTAALPGRIVLGYQKLWPYTLPQRNAVTVEFTAGYGEAEDVPASVVAAMKLILGTLYTHRESVIVGVTSQELPFAAKALLGPFRYLEA